MVFTMPYGDGKGDKRSILEPYFGMKFGNMKSNETKGRVSHFEGGLSSTINLTFKPGKIMLKSYIGAKTGPVFEAGLQAVIRGPK